MWQKIETALDVLLIIFTSICMTIWRPDYSSYVHFSNGLCFALASYNIYHTYGRETGEPNE